ncbi:aspartate kinase [Lentilactobacillus raoultii]|uniref:Aspartokinase n=1 Tax=Lentilactobacillus raoultii TaxID=1987503 RepID=A0ABW3PMT3_9LACO|nr:aspartate kinase [Lentilactobacillus raoultii]
MKVAKFGGSSVADAEQFKKVKAIVMGNDDRRAIVVSAAGKSVSEPVKVTDLLIKIEQLRDAGRDYLPVFNHIAKRFVAIRDELGLNVAIEDDLRTIKQQIPQASHDYLVSRGEFLTAKLMADFLGFRFIDASRFMFFSCDHFDYKAAGNRLKAIISQSSRIVVPGFYGVDEAGMTHLMPRGGSDISGAILANLLNADLYENWTDVSGIKMADPRIIDQSRKINELTYEELQELSYMGISVFQEEAVQPVRKKQIPIAILNTNHPEEDGTLVVDHVRENAAGLITGIAGKRDYVIISINKYQLSKRLDILSQVFAIIQRFNVSFEYLPSGTDSFSFLAKRSAVANQVEAIINALEDEVDLDSVKLETGISLVAVVSDQLSKRPAIAGKILDILDSSQIKIHLVIQESSDIKLVFGVANQDYEKTIEKIYRNVNANEKKLRMAI